MLFDSRSNKTDVPSKWSVKQIGDVITDIGDGGTPSRINSKHFGGNIPWVVISDVVKNISETAETLTEQGLSSSSAKMWPVGSIIVTTGATIGQVGIARVPLATKQGITGIVPDPQEVYPEYLAAILQESTGMFERYAQGSTFKEIRPPSLVRLNLLLPPLPEQRFIAEIFDTMDEAIQKTETLISKLKAIKQGLLHDLLTRGLDKNGELRDPKAHPEHFKDSPLGRIPKAWVIQKLGKAAPKIQDGTHFSPKTTSGPFRYLTSKNIRFGHVDLSGCGWISEKEHEAIYSRCDVRYGDVLLTKDGANTGNAAINNLNEPVSLLSSVAFIRCDERTLHSEYVFHYLLSPGCQQRIKDLMSGNAITRLTLERIKSFIIPLPDIKEQLRIIQPLNIHDTRIRTEEQYRDKLKLQKKGLMHDLLTGKVRVKV